MKKPISVFLVDDNPLFLVAASRYLAQQENFTVVGQARTGAEALEQIAQFAPELVLMDLFLPDMDGYVATSRLKALAQPPRVIILTGHSQREYRDAARAVCADGFISKSDFVLQFPVVSAMLDLREGQWPPAPEWEGPDVKIEAGCLSDLPRSGIHPRARDIAHELNNMLAPILLSVSFARDPGLAAEELQLILTDIETCAQRGAKLIKQLSAMVCDQDGPLAPGQPIAADALQPSPG